MEQGYVLIGWGSVTRDAQVHMFRVVQLLPQPKLEHFITSKRNPVPISGHSPHRVHQSCG
jgi:hypothetical protein